jgi:hypothetical protein
VIEIRTGTRGTTVLWERQVIRTETPTAMIEELQRRRIADQAVRLCHDETFTQWPDFASAAKAFASSSLRRLGIELQRGNRGGTPWR